MSLKMSQSVLVFLVGYKNRRLGGNFLNLREERQRINITFKPSSLLVYFKYYLMFLYYYFRISIRIDLKG